MSRRFSLGRPALHDGHSLANLTSSRRFSVSGNSDASADATSKDRRALLDDWRQTKESRVRECSGEDYGKQAKIPRRPASSRSKASVSLLEGTTPVERFRMRKQRKLQQKASCSQVGSSTSKSSHFRVPTLELSPGSSLSRPDAFAGSNSNVEPAEYQSSGDVEESPGNIEGIGLRSRVREMQQRVEKLEKEKMALSISTAPLEARFREKEDAWVKEQKRLLEEIDSLKSASRSWNERYRDALLKSERQEEECKKLRLAVRKASSSLSGPSYGSPALLESGWSRQLPTGRDITGLVEKLKVAEEEIDSHRLEKVSIEKELHATKIELDSVLRSFDDLQHEYEVLSENTSEGRDAEIKLEVLKTEHIATAAQLNAVCSDLAATKARTEAERTDLLNSHSAAVEKLQFEISVLKTRASKHNVCLQGKLDAGEEDEAVLKARIEERDRRIEKLESDLLKSEELRRKMHNCIQELRGNIRVYVRTRPFLPSDNVTEESAVNFSPDGESLSMMDMKHKGVGHSFKFDKVFPPSAGQDMVFQEVSDFVQSALDGYQVCLFSYGQTGSGKTHTMQGTGNGAMRGIIPRAVELILSQVQSLHSQKWTFQLVASFLEIYNEELKDLLESVSPDSRSSKKKLAIKRSREGKSFVDGLSEVQIETGDPSSGLEQLEKLMSAAARARSVASTKMNTMSSRSHSVFMLKLHGHNSENKVTVSGTLNLCDLAGSERLDRSGAGTDARRLRETQAINKSLSCLGDVFNALSQRASHVPYRNSKLTYLLQDCLSGDGKALMFVNLSPTSLSSNESLCSLRFAQRVNQVELGKATKNIQYSSKCWFTQTRAKSYQFAPKAASNSSVFPESSGNEVINVQESSTLGDIMNDCFKVSPGIVNETSIALLGSDTPTNHSTLQQAFNVTSPLDRMALTANGNLQRLFSSYYDAPVIVAVDACEVRYRSMEHTVWDRVVRLQVFGRTFCTASSEIYVVDSHFEQLVDEGKVGIAQLFRHLDKLPKFQLKDAGVKQNGGLWRNYTLSCDAMVCHICEDFEPNLWEMNP